MRTTLTIDDDVLVTARSIAQQQRISLGNVISMLARQALPAQARPTVRNGIALLPVQLGAKPVTLGLVNRLRDELA